MIRTTVNLSLIKRAALATFALSALTLPVLLGWARAPISSAIAADAPRQSEFPDITIPPRANPRQPNPGADEIYPAESKSAREEGTVLLLLTVDETGDVVDAKIEKGSGHERLDAASRAAAVDLWRFLPGTRNGKPETAQMSIRITFALEPPDIAKVK